MYSSSRNNETQFQHKMHFHKTVQDLAMYNIHKNFKARDSSELRVEDIINTVLFNCEDKKNAQICAQIYICRRIIAKAGELRLTPIFYRDPYKCSNTLYEEPTYILVKNGIFDVAKKILSRPATLLLKRCSKPSRRKIKEKAPKQKKRKTGRSIALDESLRSIVGKFPSLIIPKLSPKEIQYHMKAKYRISDLEKNKRLNSYGKRKDKSLRKPKHVKKNKENIPVAEVRRSSRLRTKIMTLNVEKNFQDNFLVVSETNYQKEDNLSVITDTYLQEDCQYTNTYFQDNNALGETKSLKDNITIKTHDNQIGHELAEKHLQMDDKCLPVVETNFQEHSEFQVDNECLPIAETNFPEHDDLQVDDKCLPIVETNFQEDSELQVDDECLPIAETNFQEHNDLKITESLENSYDAIDNDTDVIDDGMLCVYDEQNESNISSEKEEYYEIVTKHLRGGYTFDLVVKTQIDVAGDPCKHLEDEFGLDKDVVESLRNLYKSVHDGKNNYIFCELGY